VSGEGVDQAGTITASGTEFLFNPGNSTGATGTTTARFSVATDGIVGEFVLPQGTLPFLAARNFVTTVAEAAGTYNMLGRTVDTAGGPPDTTIQQGDITADGQLRSCNDNTIFEIATCPSASVLAGTVTVSGSTFTANTPNGRIVFRVAKIGPDKLFVRASASADTHRRFIIGTPATAAFTPGVFVGGTTEPAWGTITMGPSSYASTARTPAGGTITRSGSSHAVGSDTRGSLLAITTSDAGSLFAVSSTEIGVVLAARNNPVLPAFMAIGKRQ
jgi:hypothetical protein